MAFNGFPRETVDFLFALQFENTTEKQSGNLKKYKTLISAPLCELYEELKPCAESVSTRFDTKKSRCVSTPYTDRQFSEKPLKEYMYIRFKCSEKEYQPGLYFDMGSDCYSYGFRLYKQSAKAMAQMRDKLTANCEKSAKAIERIENAGFNLAGRPFKTDHFPFVQNDSLKKLLNMRSLCISKEAPINERVFTLELSEEIKDGFLCFKDFCEIIFN